MTDRLHRELQDVALLLAEDVLEQIDPSHAFVKRRAEKVGVEYGVPS